MIKGNIELSDLLNHETLGRIYAGSNDYEQAALINCLAEQFYSAMEPAAAERQECFLANNLTVNGMRFISGLAQFVEMRIKESGETLP